MKVKGERLKTAQRERELDARIFVPMNKHFKSIPPSRIPEKLATTQKLRPLVFFLYRLNRYPNAPCHPILHRHSLNPTIHNGKYRRIL
jgi:hypothetical protein